MEQRTLVWNHVTCCRQRDVTMYSPPSLLGDDKEATLLLIAKANRNSSVFTQGCFHKDFSLLSFDIVFSSKIEMVRHQTFEPQKKFGN